MGTARPDVTVACVLVSTHTTDIDGEQSRWEE
jgi:hypothetical protein